MSQKNRKDTHYPEWGFGAVTTRVGPPPSWWARNREDLEPQIHLGICAVLTGAFAEFGSPALLIFAVTAFGWFLQDLARSLR